MGRHHAGFPGRQARFLSWIGPVALLWIWSGPARAVEEEPEDDAAPESEEAQQSLDLLDNELSLLQQDLDVLTDIATRTKARKMRDVPGVVTVISREQLAQSGARDLVDVLRSVPGFQFGTDTFSSIYTGFRGVWAAEGKTLLLFDGHETYDLSYLMTLLGNRFPIDWIERIEIIRGPGSTIYGGAAELAVINVVTRTADELDGFAVEGVYGQMTGGDRQHEVPFEGRFARRNVSLQLGKRFPSVWDLGVRLGLFAGQGNRSDREYVDFTGNRYNLMGNADDDPLLFDLALDGRGLKLTYLFERYRITQRDAYDQIMAFALPATFATHAVKLRYDWDLLPALRLTPRLEYTHQKPWLTDDERARDYDQVYWDVTAMRALAGVSLSYDPRPWLNLLAGFDYQFDTAKDPQYRYAAPAAPDDDARRTVHIELHNLAGYLQALVESAIADLALGMRYEHNSRFDGSFVPRAALTRTFERFHAKLLASMAFRTPSTQNLAYDPGLRPERTTAFELELGYKLGESGFVSCNLFDTTIRKPIVYFFSETDEGTQEGYRNYDRTGSRGFELDLRYHSRAWHGSLTYSFYDAAGKNTVSSYDVPGHEHVLLGFSPHKIAIAGGVALTERLSTGASLVVLGNQRFGYRTQDEQGEPVLAELDPEWILNVHLRYQHPSGVYAGLGVYNAMNSRIAYVQPYNNGHAPLPGPSVEVLLKLGYAFRLGSNE